MTFDHFSYILVIILSISCRSLSSIPVRSQASEESFIKNNEEFIATNEWQTVKEGQAIPPGLHVRLNLQTGLRQAKLLEDTPQKSPSNDLVPVSPASTDQERISQENLQRAFANLDLSKDDVITDKKHEEEVKAKFRPYDELKKDLESMTMKVQTDHEILTTLINQLKESTNDEDRKTILTDLEFYLHQYDNAILFADMNGLDLFLQLLNSTSVKSEIRDLASLAIGAAFQGNPKVQLRGLNIGYVPYLLRLLNTERDSKMKVHLLFTLSTLLRNFPQAQLNFLQHGGIETIIRLFDQIHSNNKIKIRAMELMNDLITEKDQAIDENRDVYEKIGIRDQLVKHGWCSRISHYFSSIDSNDFEQIEKLLTVMIPLTDACRIDFISSLSILSKLANHSDLDLRRQIDSLRTNLERSFANDL